MKLTEVSMVMLGVAKLERSLRFYRDLLGLEVRNQIAGFAFVNAGHITLALSEPLHKARPISGESVELVFSVPNVKPAYEVLRERGVTFTNEPRNVNGPFWAANFNDPDGHMLSLFGNE